MRLDPGVALLGNVERKLGYGLVVRRLDNEKRIMARDPSRKRSHPQSFFFELT